MSQPPRYTVMYFDSRGRAEPIRLLLAWAGIPFEDKGLARDQWMEHKPKTGLNQLPVLIERDVDGDRVIPQTMAILRHLAREHDLYGRAESEFLAADIAAETSHDINASMNSLRFSPAWNDPQAKQKWIAEAGQTGLGRLSKLLGDRKWFASAEATWADLYVFDTLDKLEHAFPGCLDAHPKLGEFARRIRESERLKDYLARRRAA